MASKVKRNRVMGHIHERVPAYARCPRCGKGDTEANIAAGRDLGCRRLAAEVALANVEACERSMVDDGPQDAVDWTAAEPPY